MKQAFLVTLISAAAQASHPIDVVENEASQAEVLIGNILDALDDNMQVVYTMLGMDERKPKESSWDEFKFGFFDGGFKFQPRQSTTCLTDGLQYL